MKAARREREGMALLTVLLLVAVMAALSVVMLDDIRFSVRRATNASAMGQARWYGLGAETLARSQVRRLMDQNSSRTPLEPEWNGRTFDFPVDEGGAIRVTVRDGQACFNLNSVVTGQDEALARNDDGVRQFLALAAATGVAEARARAMADALVDWIDSDSRSEPLGGEDGAYAGQANPYR
ncbi:MAG: type II secretion system minor pseudopilin GspK, partial [Brevundimonas sp.]